MQSGTLQPQPLRHYEHKDKNSNHVLPRNHSFSQSYPHKDTKNDFDERINGLSQEDLINENKRALATALLHCSPSFCSHRTQVTTKQSGQNVRCNDFSAVFSGGKEKVEQPCKNSRTNTTEDLVTKTSNKKFIKEELENFRSLFSNTQIEPKNTMSDVKPTLILKTSKYNQKCDRGVNLQPTVKLAPVPLGKPLVNSEKTEITEIDYKALVTKNNHLSKSDIPLNLCTSPQITKVATAFRELDDSVNITQQDSECNLSSNGQTGSLSNVKEKTNQKENQENLFTQKNHSDIKPSPINLTWSQCSTFETDSTFSGSLSHLQDNCVRASSGNSQDINTPDVVIQTSSSNQSNSFFPKSMTINSSPMVR